MSNHPGIFLLRRSSIACCICLAVVAFNATHSLGTDSDDVLIVRAKVAEPLRLTQRELSAMPRRSVRAKDQTGKESLFEGVFLRDILARAGVKFGEELRGKALADYLLVEAGDDYRVVFALPELDPSFTDHVVLLADKRDGKPLGGNEGPLRLIVPHEKRPSRWVRHVIAITLVQGPSTSPK